jgi:MFS family permease
MAVCRSGRRLLTRLADFDHPDGALLGITSASYNLGGLLVLPIVPWVVDRIGRKHSITLGSVVLVIGTILQTCSVNSKNNRPPNVTAINLGYYFSF